MMYGILEFGMGPTAEAIAHFVHGGVTVFFIVWTWLLWPSRQQSNMMYMLFLNMLYWAFCNVKDLIFLVDGFWEDWYLSGISITLDLLYVPIMANFFIEVVFPGWVNRRRVLVPMAVQALFVIIFIINPSETVMNASFATAYGGGAVAMILVCILAARNRRYIHDNYSCTDHIDVSWSIWCGVLLFICLTLYIIVFSSETWLGGAIFQLICVGTWLYLYCLSRRHTVVEVPLSVFTFPLVRKDISGDDDCASKETYDYIAERLDACMNKDKLYLNPKLSLQDVVVAIGTNRTYLSDYLNHVLGTTFYEYINALRVREACSIIDSSRREKRTLQEIADAAGFNSGSTFNRSFVKIVGMTPGEYVKRRG